MMTKSELINHIKDQKAILNDMQIGVPLWTIMVSMLGCVAYLLFNIKDWQQFDTEVMPWLCYVIPFYIPLMFIFKSLKEKKLNDWYNKYSLNHYDKIKFVYLFVFILCIVGCYYYTIDTRVKLINIALCTGLGCVFSSLQIARKAHQRVPYFVHRMINVFVLLFLLCSVVQKAYISGLPSRENVYTIGVAMLFVWLIFILLELFIGESALKIKVLDEQLYNLECHDTFNADKELQAFNEVVAGCGFFDLFRKDLYKLKRSHVNVSALIENLNKVDTNKLTCDDNVRKQVSKIGMKIVGEYKFQIKQLLRMQKKSKRLMKNIFLSEDNIKQLDELSVAVDYHIGLLGENINKSNEVINSLYDALKPTLCRYAKYKIGSFCPVVFWHNTKGKAESCKMRLSNINELSVPFHK